MSETMFKPASLKQEQFINSDSFVTVYGGKFVPPSTVM